MITEQQVEEDVHWLLDNAQRIGEVRARRVLLEEGRKSIKAEIMTRFNDLSLGAQEREAYAHKEYRDYLKNMSKVVAMDETNKLEVVGRQQRIAAFQTQSANLRGRL